MKKNTLSLALLLGFSTVIYAQVGINTKTPSTIFDIRPKRDDSGNITDNTQTYGLQAPRLTRAELTNNLASYGTDQNGALIYITDVSGGSATPGTQQENVTSVGYYYFDAAAASNAGRWQKVANTTGGSAYTANNGLTLSGNNIKLGGALTEPTTISAVTATNKLSITGTGVDAVNFDSGTLSIDATNNRIGINTTSPKGLFHVVNSSSGTNIDSAIFGIDNCGLACAQSTARNVVLYNGNTTNTDFSSIDFVPSNDSTKPSGAVIRGIDRDATNNYAGLAFLTRNSSGFDNRMIIRSSGNVGIGVSNPATKLDINNGTTNGAIKIVDGTQGSGKVLTSDANGLATWQTPTSYTATASNGLTMSGSNTKLGGSLTENTTITQGDNPLNIIGNSNLNLATTNTSANPLNITYPLNNLANSGILISGASGTPATGQSASIGLNPNASQGVSPISIGAQYINGSSGQGAADFFVATSSGGVSTKKFVVQNGGNVGIDVTSPNEKLDVNGNVKFRAVPNSSTLNSTDKIMVLASDGTGKKVDVSLVQPNATTANNGLTKTGDNIQLGGTLTKETTVAQNGNNMIFSGNGKLGIGTASPSQKLDVDGSARVANKMTVGSSWNGAALAVDNNVASDPILAISGTSSQRRVTVLDNGNTGIGSQSPSEKLEVAGNIAITPSGGVSAVKFYENSSNGANAVSVQAPDNLPANRTITLPSNAPLNGYVLMTNSSGVTQWGSVSPPAATLASISLSNENTGSTSVTNGGNAGATVNQRFFQKFDTTVTDPNSRFNVTNGTYTVSQSGIYMISAYIMPNAAPDKNTSGFFYPVNLEIRKNAGGNPTGGTNIMDNATIRWATPGQTKIRYSVVVTGMVSLSAGDTLNLVVYLNGQNANANATGGYSFPSDFTYAQVSDFKALFSVTAL